MRNVWDPDPETAWALRRRTWEVTARKGARGPDTHDSTDAGTDTDDGSSAGSSADGVPEDRSSRPAQGQARRA